MEHPLHAGFLAVYLAALIGVGALKAGKIKSQEDFSLAGRGLGAVVLVGTLLATWIGTGSIVGNAEKTYRIGVSALLLPVGSAFGIVMLFLIAKRIRTFGQFTIQDILEARFGVGARVLATFALLGAYIVIVSYQYRAGAGVLAEIVPDAAHWQLVCAVAAFVIAYTALAGMFSVAYTDVANGVLMTVGAFCAVPILWSAAGGWSGALEALEPAQQGLTSNWTTYAFLGAVVPPFLLMLGDANMYQRFFSAKDPATARRSAFLMFFGVMALELVIILIALLSMSLVRQGELAPPSQDGYIILHAAFYALPPFLGAMLISTAIAIVVSTADSYLLAPSTSLVRDVYQRFFKPDAEGREVVVLGRVLVVVLGLVALGLAFASDEFFEVAIFAYTLYGCSITPALFAAFFWRRATRFGAMASIVVGAGVATALRVVAADTEGATGFWAQVLGEPVLLAFPCSILALVGVSLVTPAPSEEQSRVI